MSSAPQLRRVVVTGGAGFIGSHLCERLVERGAAVVCVDDLCTGSEENVAQLCGSGRFELRRADVSEPFDVEGEVSAVLHLASPASPVDYARLPLETLCAGTLGTRNALELARRKGARFLLASTSEVYGDPEVHPQTEDYWGHVNPIGPRSVYDEAKRAAEAFTMAYRRVHGVQTRIARIFNTYGPRMRTDDGRAVPAFMTQALRDEGLSVFGDGAQTRSLCYVSDLVEGLERLLASDHALPVNLGNPHEVTVRELAEMIRDLVGGGSAIEERPLPLDDPRRRRPDISTARRVLGWEPRVALEEGLARTLEWFREALSTRRVAAHPVAAASKDD